MDYEYLKKTLEDMFYSYKEPPSRKITLWTGAGGADLFDECIEKDAGYTRIYVTKAPRFLKKHLKTSRTGKLYKRYGRNRFITTGKDALGCDYGYVYSSHKS